MPGISQADFVGQQQQHQLHQQHHQQQQQHVVNPTLAHNYAAPQPMKDPIKVVYSNSANNRNYAPVNSLPNGTINSTSTGTSMLIVKLLYSGPLADLKIVHSDKNP